MRKTVFFALFAAALLANGCAGEKGFLESPFEHHSHETFIRAGTGETGLYIEGEPWCALIDLHGFRNSGMSVESSNEFLVRRNSKGIFVSVFAEKIDTVTSDESCQRSIYRRLFHQKAAEPRLRTIGGRKVLFNTYEGWKQIDYCPYYNGYCFDFQFSMKENVSEKALQGILQSIVFVDDLSSKGKIQKIFYLYNRQLQLGMANTWKYTMKEGFPNTPTIVFSTADGNAFSLHISPYAGFEKNSEVTRDEVVKLLRDKMARWQERNAEVPVVIEIINDRKELYLTYFDVKDMYYHQGDYEEFPFLRQGYVMMGNVVFSFRLYYRDEGRDDAEKGINALEHMKLLDITTEPVIEIGDSSK
jgi:hypothetical protein